MGTLLPENLCAHRKGEIEELIKGRAREMAAQPQILFGKLTGDQDGLEELLEKLMTPLTESLFHVLMSSCEVCGVSQISNQVRSPIGDQRSVDPGESSKRPVAEDRSGCCKRRCTDKHDQGCQGTKQVLRIQETPQMYPTNYFGHHTCRACSPNNPSQNPLLEPYLLGVQRIQEAPQMYPTNYFGHHTCRAYSPNNPSQNPLLEPYLLGFPSMTITTQYSEPSSRSFPSMTISTQDSESYPRSFSSKTQDLEPYRLSFSSMTISTQDSEPYSEESVQSNSVSGDLQFLPPLRFIKSEDEREMCARTIYCTNIDKKVTQADVKLFFESICGEVQRSRLIGDYNHSTRIAFVEFVMAESAIAALNCSGVVLGSLSIRVSPGKTPVRPRARRSPMH